MPDLVEPVIGFSALELLELASLLLALESEADLPDLPEDSLTGLSVGLAVIVLDVVGLAVVFGLDVVGKDVTGLTVGPTVGFMDER